MLSFAGFRFPLPRARAERTLRRRHPARGLPGRGVRRSLAAADRRRRRGGRGARRGDARHLPRRCGARGRERRARAGRGRGDDRRGAHASSPRASTRRPRRGRACRSGSPSILPVPLLRSRHRSPLRRHRSSDTRSGLVSPSRLAGLPGQCVAERDGAIAPLRGAPTPALLARVAAGQVGGVILLGNSWTSRGRSGGGGAAAVGACRRGSPLLVGVDQEGGRFAACLGATAGSRQARTAAEARRQRGSRSATPSRGRVGIDFAPVSDTSTPRSFLGTRAFGTDPSLVARWQAPSSPASRPAASRRRRSTSPGSAPARAPTTDAVTSRESGVPHGAARAFPAAIAAGTKLVMVSNASYPALDPTGVQAVFSHTIVTGLLRDRSASTASSSPTRSTGSVCAVPHAPAVPSQPASTRCSTAGRPRARRRRELRAKTRPRARPCAQSWRRRPAARRKTQLKPVPGLGDPDVF